MLFGVKLNNEVYPPWEKHYIAYEYLKKYLKESVISDKSKWTEEDESRFVEALDSELEKVYSFESKKYHELSERLTIIEKQIEQPANLDAKELEAKLEAILEDATHLDKFRRINYTGFTKIVKKHDRLHNKYQVGPLLRVRLSALPFHSEDYSPLLYRLSNIYKFLKENFGSVAKSATTKSAVLSESVAKSHLSGYTTLQFWVHPEDLMEVKAKILRRLPVLVYNRDDEDELGADPTVTSLYLDTPDFRLYQSQLEKRREDDVPTSLRFRWHGHLYEKPDITLEQQNEEDGRITRISLKDKNIQKFMEGNKQVIEKNIAKMKQKHATQAVIDDYKAAAEELQTFIITNDLQPMLRTIYKRSAFEIPGDDRVRVILDQDILFIREDALDSKHPIRDPSSWHRADLDQPNVDLRNALRKGEFTRFSPAVLEIRLRQSMENKKVEKIPWVEEMIQSQLIKAVPHFTKFLHGIATLYGEDDHLDSLPFWLNDMEHDFRQDLPVPSSSNRPTNRVNYNFTDSQDDEDEDSDDSVVVSAETAAPAGPSQQGVGIPTWTNQGPKLADADSEDEEVELPPGVNKPSQWIKNQSSVKVEAKVWLANERTFNKWLHITCLLSALTFTIYSSVEKSTSPAVATVVAYILFALTLFSGIWGYTQYLRRVELIKARGERHFDNPVGPLIVAIGLLIALVINLFASLHHRRQSHSGPSILHN